MILMLLATVLPASAWDVSETPDGYPLRFIEMPVRWRFDPAHGPHHLDPEQQHAAVERAFAAWTGVDGAPVEFVEDTESPPQAVSIVRWEPHWESDPDFLALTSAYAGSDGYITRFDLVLNGEVQNWAMDGDPDGMDLENTLVHEVGHGLGLAHSDIEEATMYYQTLPGDLEKRDIHADDAEGLVYLYTPDDAEPPTVLDVFNCATLPGVPPAWSAVLLFAATRRTIRRRAPGSRPV